MHLQLKPTTYKKESKWDFSKVVAVVVDSAHGQEKCSRQFAQVVKKNVKFLLSPAEIVQFIVKNAIQNEKIAAVKRGPFFSGQWPGNKPFALDTLQEVFLFFLPFL